MVGPVVAAGDIQRVVQIAELDTAFGVGRPLESQAPEGSVLIEAGSGSRVGFVEVEEGLVPNHKTESRKQIERALGADQLAKPPAEIIARFQKRCSSRDRAAKVHWPKVFDQVTCCQSRCS